MYEYILTLIKYIYGLLQSARCCVKEYIKTITPKVIFKKFKSNTCLLYMVNELGTEIFIVYVDDMLEIGDKTELMDKIECTNE